MPTLKGAQATADREKEEVKRIKKEARKYTEESFVIPATDEHGRGYPLTCNVMPFVKREIEEIIFSRKFPFGTKGDVVRWCIFWGLRRLEEYQPRGGTGFLRFIEIQIQRLRDQLYITKIQEAGGTLDEVVQYYLKDGDEYGQMRAYATVVEAYEKAMEIKQPYWRKKTRAAIRKKYGQLLASPPKQRKTVDLDPETWADGDEAETEGEEE